MYGSTIYSIDDLLNKEIRFMLALTNLDQLILQFFPNDYKLSLLLT